MALTDQIQSDLTASMKARDGLTTTTLRSVVAAIKNARVASGSSGEVDDDQVLDLVAKEAKRRKEAIEAAEAAGRDEMAAKERAELTILERYLPAQLDRAAIAVEVDAVIAEVGAEGPGDLGKVMGPAMARLKGRADGKTVNAVVRERLGA